jgi:predicted site-specific integrase-resolvase
MQNHDEFCLISPSETAKILGVSTSTLAKWRMTGLDGPAFVKLGARVKYDREAVRRFVAACTRRSTSDLPNQAA